MMLAMRCLAVWIKFDSVSWGLAMLSLAIMLGLALGAIRVRGIRLGVSGVLFSCLLFGQFGARIDPTILTFLRDFALIIFVYAIGLQVGPGFFASLRQEGLRLNLLSIAVIVFGAFLTGLFVLFCHLPRYSASGLYTGAFTTTPGLAAGQEALQHKLERWAPQKIGHATSLAGLAYTVTYPFGIVGPILAIVLLQRIFRIDVPHEHRELIAREQERRPPIEHFDFQVTQSLHTGRHLKDHPLLRSKGIVLSRLLRDQTVSVPTGDTEIRLGDVYRAVGTRQALDEVVSVLGQPAKEDVFDTAGDVQRMELVVTRTQVLRRTLAELDLIRRYGVNLVRINRNGVELATKATLRLQFGDVVNVVGPMAGLKDVEMELGNCPDILNRPQLVPIFLGIFLGILVGTIPIMIPGLHSTLRIGLAGGPMIAAILLAQLGNVGSVVWYMPVAANQLFRDFGLAVFLGCVGLQAGDHFYENVRQNHALVLVAWGLVVTILPVFIVGCIARLTLKVNFLTLSGWVAGAMTSSPALLFANDLAPSDAPAIAYAAVAPLGMLMPILCAQLLVIYF
jgi:putative transport protein